MKRIKVAIDLAHGGFPCQDISTAGYQAGLEVDGQHTRPALHYDFATGRLDRSTHEAIISSCFQISQLLPSTLKPRSGLLFEMTRIGRTNQIDISFLENVAGITSAPMKPGLQICVCRCNFDQTLRTQNVQHLVQMFKYVKRQTLCEIIKELDRSGYNAQWITLAGHNVGSPQRQCQLSAGFMCKLKLAMFEAV